MLSRFSPLFFLQGLCFPFSKQTHTHIYIYICLKKHSLYLDEVDAIAGHVKGYKRRNVHRPTAQGRSPSEILREKIKGGGKGGKNGRVGGRVREKGNGMQTNLIDIM